MNESLQNQAPKNTLPNGIAPKGVAPKVVPSLAEAMQSEKAGTHVMAARRALRKGDRDGTRALLKQAFAASANDLGALELLGDLFLEEGEQEKAVAVFERGRNLHPRHAAFEEKIALARLDLAEIEHDRIVRREFAEKGDLEEWQDRKPSVSAMLSALIPGLGQVYNDHWERGAALCGAAIVAFTAWLWPLSATMSAASSKAGKDDPKSVFENIAGALVNMGAGMKLFLALCIATWLAVHAFAAWDAAQIAIRAAQDRRRRLGIWE